MLLRLCRENYYRNTGLLLWHRVIYSDLLCHHSLPSKAPLPFDQYQTVSFTHCLYFTFVEFSDRAHCLYGRDLRLIPWCLQLKDLRWQLLGKIFFSLRAAASQNRQYWARLTNSIQDGFICLYMFTENDFLFIRSFDFHLVHGPQS